MISNKLCSSSLQDVHLRTIDLALAFGIPAIQLEPVFNRVRSHCRTYAATRCNANHSRVSSHDLRGAQPRVTQKTCQLLGVRVCHCFLKLYLVRVMIETGSRPNPTGAMRPPIQLHGKRCMSCTYTAPSSSRRIDYAGKNYKQYPTAHFGDPISHH